MGMENNEVFALWCAMGAVAWGLRGVEFSYGDIALFYLYIYLAFCFCVVFYRLFLSPIRHIPGPWLAAATFGYEFYYDIWPHSFRYMWQIQKLHDKYGPIVRINPLHVHIMDHGAFYDDIHPGDHRKKRDRCKWFSHYGKNVFMNGGLTQAMDHDFHRNRRLAIAPLFSKKNVYELQPLVKSKVNKLVFRLDQAMREKTIVNMTDAMSALTMDIISGYCFGKDVKQLDNPDFAAEWVYQLQEGAKVRGYARHLPWLVNNMLRTPGWVTKMMQPHLGPMIDFEDELQERIQYMMDHPDEPSEEGHRTIFNTIKSTSLPPEEKTARRLAAEASTFIGAGTETTGRVLAVTAFHLLSDPAKLERLRAELKTVMPKPDSNATLPDLERLPYLTAVAYEGLRIANGVSSRMPRRPHEPLTFTAETERFSPDGKREVVSTKTYLIPAWTSITTSIYLLHHDEYLFPDSHAFKPERWIDNIGLRQHFYAFARGNRGCLGQNLAWSECYQTIAAVFRLFEMELHDTYEERDVAVVRDCSIGMLRADSVGVRVKVVGKVKE